MKSMWWLVSSSFSKSQGFKRYPANEDGEGRFFVRSSTSSPDVQRIPLVGRMNYLEVAAYRRCWWFEEPGHCQISGP